MERSVTEATVAKWLKSQGEKVVSDEPIVELETDKVNVEVPSPSNGTLEKISVNEGETVNVGALLGTISVSSLKNKESDKDIKSYKPPLKKEKTEKIRQTSKKTQPKETIQDVLILEDELPNEEQEPLKLTDTFSEKKKITTAPRKLKKIYLQLQEKWSRKLD